MPDFDTGSIEQGSKDIFQSIEFGVFGDIPEEDRNLIGQILREVFGTDSVSIQTAPDIQGGRMVVPLQTDKVFVGDIEEFLDTIESESIASTLWSVTARVKGVEGIEPLKTANQLVTIDYSRMPNEAVGYDEELKNSIIRGLTEKGFPGGASNSSFTKDQVKSIEVDILNQRTEILFDKNIIDNSDMNGISRSAGRLSVKFSNMVLEEEIGKPGERDPEESIELSNKLSDVHPTQISIQATEE